MYSEIQFVRKKNKTQLDGPSPTNSFGYDVSVADLQQAAANHEVAVCFTSLSLGKS